jgi:hypothetical protein
MTLRSLLRRLENVAHKAPRVERPETDEDFLARFEAWDREGRFAAEPDFPMALACYRDALAQERRMEPSGLQLHHKLLGTTPQRSPALEAAWVWLAEMSLRSLHGIPPVTEVEFRELETWFELHADRMERLALPLPYFDLGNGRLTSATNIRYELARGPRAFGAGKIADEVRRLKAIYGEIER